MIERISRAIATACRNKLDGHLQEDATNRIQEIQRAALAFADEADALGLATAPRPDQARDFATWLEGLIAVPKNPMCFAAVDALDAGMRAAVAVAAASPDVAALIPADYYADLEWEHAPSKIASRDPVDFTQAYATSFHQMLGHAPLSQAVDSEGIVLLNLVSDDALGFMFCDAGEATFWIEPDDLAARRFDKVFATAAGG